MLPGEYMTGGLKKEQRSKEVKLHRRGRLTTSPLDVKTCYRHQSHVGNGKGSNRAARPTARSGIGPNRNALNY